MTAPGTERPYCNACGYDLSNLTESSKCPECGRPIVEVLMRPSFGARRYIRYRSTTTFMGVPVVSIASGPYADERLGRAVGVIAIGDIATGIIAVGAVARGVIALGSLSIGIISFGALAIGVTAFGGVAVGALAVGGVAVGGVSVGGVSAYLLRGFGGALWRIPGL